MPRDNQRDRHSCAVKPFCVQGYCTVLHKRKNLTQTTYTNLRQTLAFVLDRVANDHEVVIVGRKGHKRSRWFRQTSWPG
jgi:hypothetical protein